MWTNLRRIFLTMFILFMMLSLGFAVGSGIIKKLTHDGLSLSTLCYIALGVGFIFICYGVVMLCLGLLSDKKFRDDFHEDIEGPGGDPEIFT